MLCGCYVRCSVGDSVKIFIWGSVKDFVRNSIKSYAISFVKNSVKISLGLLFAETLRNISI